MRVLRGDRQVACGMDVWNGRVEWTCGMDVWQTGVINLAGQLSALPAQLVLFAPPMRIRPIHIKVD